MEVFAWIYGVGAIVTMGAALGVGRRADILGIVVFGLIWPVLWIAVVVFAVVGPYE